MAQQPLGGTSSAQETPFERGPSRLDPWTPSPSLDVDPRSTWYRGFFEESPFPMWVFDPQTLRFLDVNGAALRHYGYTREEWLSMTARELRSPEETPRLEAFLKTLPPGTNDAGIWRHRRKDGSPVEMAILAHWITFDGRSALLILARDVTGAREAENTLRKISPIMEHMADAVVITDRDGTIEYVNAGFERVTGYSKDEVLGKNPRILKSGRQGEAFYTDLWNTILSGRVYRGVLVNRKKDGTLYDEEKTITPIHDTDGTITGFVSIDRDVTALREAEGRAARNEQLASLGRMAAFIAHEINNPLTNISLLATSLQRTSRDPEVLEAAKKIDEQRFLAVRILADLLSFAKPLEVRPQETDLRAVVEKALAQAESHRPEGVALSASVGNDPIPIQADPLRILEVIVNLLRHALEATEAGTVSVSVEARPDAVTIRVADEGGGMPLEALARLFEPFTSTKGSGLGTGLGLAVSKSLVEAHGGRIEVASVPGKGTTFTVVLPPGGREANSPPKARA